MLPEIIVAPPAELADRLSERLEDEARAAIASRGRFAVALSGGSIADVFYSRLSRAEIDWQRVEFFWCDERAVPPDHPDSNYRAADSLWLRPAGVDENRVHRMNADTQDLAAAADSYAAVLLQILGTPPRLDVALLGVGPDGHVCSLFPGHAALREERRWVVAITDAPKSPARRLTLTFATLAAARLIVVAAFGEAKASAVRSAVDDAHSTLPLALALRRAARACIFVDPKVGEVLKR